MGLRQKRNEKRPPPRMEEEEKYAKMGKRGRPRLLHYVDAFWGTFWKLKQFWDAASGPEFRLTLLTASNKQGGLTETSWQDLSNLKTC